MRQAYADGENVARHVIPRVVEREPTSKENTRESGRKARRKRD
jgi:hypothetical protein